MKSVIRPTQIAVGFLVIGAALLTLSAPAFAAEKAEAYVGHWALDLPGGGAGWLGVTQEKGYLDAGILWGGGSVHPVASAYVDDSGALCITRLREIQRKDADGKVVRKHTFTETIRGQLSGGSMKLVRTRARPNGIGLITEEFTGKHTPPLPPKPDLSKVKYGQPIALLKGDSLEGWKLTNPRAANGWSVKDGTLINNPVQREGRRHVSYGNLRTEREFEDFNLKLEALVGKGQNSGVYLRGIYEVQVSDSYGRGTDSHNMGAVYSRLKPTVSAEKPPGQWQTLDLTLLDRHVTVKLNATTIIDNEPLLGCTGGALWSDPLRPGPIYLQGDHSPIKYRNIVLRPIVK